MLVIRSIDVAEVRLVFARKNGRKSNSDDDGIDEFTAILTFYTFALEKKNYQKILLK